MLLGLERVLDDVGVEDSVGARHGERRCLVYAPGERLDLAIQVGELDHVARADHVEALADVGQAAKLGEIRKLQLHAAEFLVERVIPADRDRDELERHRGCGVSCGNLIRRGWQEIIDRRIEQRVFYLGANCGKDGAGDDAGCNDAETPRFCGGNGMGCLRK